MTVRVVLVDDHRVLGEALAALLCRVPDIDVVATLDVADIVESVCERMAPDVVVMDVELGDRSGIDLTAALRQSTSPPQVVVLTCHDDPQVAAAAVRAGASGFVPKDVASSELIDAVRAAARGESHIPSRILGRVLEELQRSPEDPASEEQERLGRLSSREREILEMIVTGVDRSAMAARLCLSANTVRTHIQNIFKKLDVHSMLEAAAFGRRVGIMALEAGPQFRSIGPRQPRATPDVIDLTGDGETHTAIWAPRALHGSASSVR